MDNELYVTIDARRNYEKLLENKFTRERFMNKWTCTVITSEEFVAERLSSVGSAEARSWWPPFWRQSQGTQLRQDGWQQRTRTDTDREQKSLSHDTRNGSFKAGTTWKCSLRAEQLNVDCSYTGRYTLSVKLSDFTVWLHTWRKNCVNCSVLTGNSASFMTVLSNRSFTQITALFTQGIPQFTQFTCRHHDGIIWRHSAFQNE